MGKLLSWVLIGLLAYLVLRVVQAAQRRALQSQSQGQAPRVPQRPDPAARELMVRCEACGTWVPDSEALVRDGHPFCSPAHRDQQR